MQIPGLPPIGLALGSGGQAIRALGEFAGRLRKALTPGTEAASTSPAATPGPSAAEALQAELKGLEAEIRSVLAGAGVGTSPPIRLTQDAFDHLRVVGPHPQSEQIEAALLVRPEIGDRFRALAAAAAAVPTGTPTGIPPVYEVGGRPTFEMMLENRLGTSQPLLGTPTR